MSVYSRRSSSSSSGRSNSSTTTVRTAELNVPRSKSLSVVTYLAGGDPRKHKNLRRTKITTEYDNGTYETTSQYFWVRDPYASTYYWGGDYDDYDDSSSVYSGSSRGSSRRSKHGGPKGRGLPTAVPVQPMPPPPQQMGMPPMGMGMGMPPGIPPPHMGGHPQAHMGGPPPGVQVVDEMDDDASSMYSGSSYFSDESSYSSHGMPPPHPHGMGMPHMHQQPPPPPMMMHPGGPHMGPPMMSGAGPAPPRSHRGGGSDHGGDMPDFIQIS
ncbi:hypothetical protein KVR01_012600 [Diaporthe batatas]|uniref:uncharacterized protein n=1 Tax=Diaporthe batatas TaxID=748121 RepID=UPI001D03D4B9|nr:uncharacterized protein KVR01_012600 [Diaporthe batatas]KAG8157558.1 hypothetical protein KVR01_012600 [Diaporthe batatas]